MIKSSLLLYAYFLICVPIFKLSADGVDWGSEVCMVLIDIKKDSRLQMLEPAIG